jgi:hypothetical protein
MPTTIQPGQIPEYTAAWKTVFSTGCHCGWYHFYYAECGHHCPTALENKEKNPELTFLMFCKTPAPVTHVRSVVISGSCSTCTS